MYVIMLEKIPGIEATRDQIRRHVEHLRALDAAEKLVLCGPFTDHPGGMVVVRVEDIAEARRIAEADPFVGEGVRRYELRTWLMANAANGYLDPGLPDPTDGTAQTQERLVTRVTPGDRRDG